jgi:hypothetical protein
MENPPGPGPSEAGPSADRGEPSSAPLPVETPDFAKQLLDVERRLREDNARILEDNARNEFLASISAFESECKRLSHDILLGNKEFHSRCFQALKLRGDKFPMLDKTLLDPKDYHIFDTDAEEGKLQRLLKALLESQKMEDNISNLWQLERDLKKSDGIESILIPFLEEYGSKRKRKE